MVVQAYRNTAAAREDEERVNVEVVDDATNKTR